MKHHHATIRLASREQLYVSPAKGQTLVLTNANQHIIIQRYVEGKDFPVDEIGLPLDPDEDIKPGLTD